ncbi:MAG: Rrf2 family transcriptional regulator [Rhodospirillales bacterium]|jgi:Rrf2 family nitric oxide-sensitive transcriptional repressor|nr:Rrf2 family transcriptional regulator [Rhodospirillales bacterium]
MRLTSFTDFGLRVLMRLAGRPGEVMNTDQVAREFDISRHHLQKVVQELAAAGFLRTRRGAGGGLTLARPASEIRLGEVVRALEHDQALVECYRSDGGACRLTPYCRLRGELDRAAAAFLACLDETTLDACAYGGELAAPGEIAAPRRMTDRVS